MAIEDMSMGQASGYAVEFVHTHSEGLCVNPVAGKGPQNASIVRLHAPFERISVYWFAISRGTPPVLPSYKSFFTNANRLFLGGERYGVVTPDLVGHIWQATGRFDYSVVAPEGLDSQFNFGKCPWEGLATDNAVDFYIPAQYFQPGIINPTLNQPYGFVADPDVPILNLQMGVLAP